MITVADSLDAIKGDAAHLGQPGDSGGLHIHKAGLVGGGEALLFVDIGDSGAGDQPAIAGRAGGKKALSGAGIDDAGDVQTWPGESSSRKAPAQPVEMTASRGPAFSASAKARVAASTPAPGAGGNPLALVEFSAPEIAAV